eukprot:GHVU01075142.1.p1 GENE.GHVU01075142.1~~GHVU01075142.1.p1  ORF type:complete len:330 (-),score=40.10 GHVU01075142.1:416-1405(-)
MSQYPQYDPSRYKYQGGSSNFVNPAQQQQPGYHQGAPGAFQPRQQPFVVGAAPPAEYATSASADRGWEGGGGGAASSGPSSYQPSGGHSHHPAPFHGLPPHPTFGTGRPTTQSTGFAPPHLGLAGSGLGGAGAAAPPDIPSAPPLEFCSSASSLDSGLGGAEAPARPRPALPAVSGFFGGIVNAPDPTAPLPKTTSPTGDFETEDEAPLLEELGINFPHILQRMKAATLFQKIDQDLLADCDMSGPLFSVLCMGLFFLLRGKVHFGYIYGICIVGCLGTYCLLNLMSQRAYVSLRARAFVCVRMLVHVCVSMCACMRVCMRVCVHVCAG